MSSIWTTPDDGSRYLEKLLKEMRILSFHAHDLPICNNLLNEEILRVSAVLSNQEFNIFDGPQSGRPNLVGLLDRMPNVASLNLGRLDGNSGWKPCQQGFSGPQGTPIDHTNAVPASPSSLLTRSFLRLDVPVDSFPNGFSGRQGTPIDQTNAVRAIPSSLITRKFLRLDVPVDGFPNFNFVGRLLGPRGNSLKRIEDLTGCRLFIRGKGSMKDPSKEEFLRRMPGYGHLNEPLHVLIESKGPVNEVDAQLKQAQEIILELFKPMSKSQDSYKRQQLKELAVLNSRFKESASQASSSNSGSTSSYRSGAMKRTTRKGKK